MIQVLLRGPRCQVQTSADDGLNSFMSSQDVAPDHDHELDRDSFSDSHDDPFRARATKDNKKVRTVIWARVVLKAV